MAAILLSITSSEPRNLWLLPSLPCVYKYYINMILPDGYDMCNWDSMTHTCSYIHVDTVIGLIMCNRRIMWISREDNSSWILIPHLFLPVAYVRMLQVRVHKEQLTAPTPTAFPAVTKHILKLVQYRCPDWPFLLYACNLSTFCALEAIISPSSRLGSGRSSGSGGAWNQTLK